MHYLIDGYNMMFRLCGGRGDLMQWRESFLDDLGKKLYLLEMDAAIIFDAAQQMGGRSRCHRGALSVWFSAAGETADEYILDEVIHTLHPCRETVVTSDKKLGRQVRDCSVRVESVEVFASRLDRIYRNKLRRMAVSKCSYDPPPARTSAAEAGRTEMERWLELFERRLAKGDED